MRGKETKPPRRPAGRDPLVNLMTVAQVAAKHHVPPRNVNLAIQRHDLPAWVVAHVYLVPRSDAEEWSPKKRAPRKKTGAQAVDN